MRPSTLIALLISLTIGLMGLAGARALNLFSGQKPVAIPQISVLVSTQNVIKGTVLDPRMVRIRAMRPNEVQHYAQVGAQFLPATEAAVSLRIAKVNILADQPILEDQLEPFEGSDGIPKRLAPNMHDVTIGVLQEDSAGGHVRVGDWVDVYFTAKISGPGVKESLRQVRIASNARVIVKRNNLLPIFAPLPAGKIPFTLETNSYRAALIDYARDKGDFRLMSLAESVQRKLELARKKAMESANRVVAEPDSASDTLPAEQPMQSDNPELHRIAFIPMESTEYLKEKSLVEVFEKEQAPISSLDLQKLFGIIPPVRGVKKPKRVIEQFAGTRRLEDVEISPRNQIENSQRSPQQSNNPNNKVVDESFDDQLEYTFTKPPAPSNDSAKDR